MPEPVQEVGPIELLDPLSLQEPWRSVVWHWMHNHPTRVFLPELDSPAEYRLSWDDLRDILVVAGVLESRLSIV